LKKSADIKPIPIIFDLILTQLSMSGHLALSFVVIYLSLSFVYSAIEKIIQWEKCKGYYRLHFKHTFIKNQVPAAIILVLIMEIISVGLNLYGLYILFHTGNAQVLLNGLIAIAITLILLMTGQRIAQDYSGAMNITVYFMLTVFGIFLIEYF